MILPLKLVFSVLSSTIHSNNFNLDDFLHKNDFLAPILCLKPTKLYFYFVFRPSMTSCMPSIDELLMLFKNREVKLSNLMLNIFWQKK